MLKYIASFFWREIPDPEEILTLDDAYRLLKDSIQPSQPKIFAHEPTRISDKEKEELHEAELELEDYMVETKTGYVTEIIGGVCTIDKKYEFKDNVENIAIGSKVSYQLTKTAGIVDVTNVNLLENDWEAEEAAIQRQKWCVRTHVCQVVERRGRILKLDNCNVEVDLNAIASEFIPIVGDFVELEVKSVVDEGVVDLSGRIIQVLKIFPVRPHLEQGKVTSWDQHDQCGVINKNIHFSKESLYCGYVPVKGETVVAEIIESYQGSCIWRALKIMPNYIHQQKTSNLNDFNVGEDIKDSHTGLKVSMTEIMTFEKLGEKKMFFIDFKNEGDEDLTYVKIEFPRSNGQCKLNKKIGEDLMKTGEEISLKIECTSKCMGETSEAMVLHFEGFKIRRWVKMKVELADHVENGRKSTYVNPIYTERSQRDLVRGQRLKMAARFIAVRIPDYTVPQRLLDLVTHNQDGREIESLKEKLELMKPVLVSNLSHLNYEDKFHTLVHLDEIHTILAMRNYDQSRACFIKCAEFLLLEIENLGERRPSIIVGDRVIARSLYSEKTPDFEGIIHKIGRQHVYIKFAPSFHNSYNGEDHSIVVLASRTTYRREHYAVSLAVKNLGKDVLFPAKVPEKEAQLSFIFDPYVDELNPSDDSSTSDDGSQKSQKSTRRSFEKKAILEKIHQFQVKNAKTVTVPKLEWFNTRLNFYQKEAVRNILSGVCRPLPYIIFGPPGTGKTVTVVEAILQIVRMLPQSRILVSAPSNSAADLLAFRLIDSGVLKPGDLVRLVAHSAVGAIPSKLAPYSATANIEKQGTETEAPCTTSSGLVLGLNSKSLGRHKITVCTCSSAGTLYSLGFPKGHFSHIFVDEAGQTSEPCVMIPLAFLDTTSGQAVLAGDPMQLGPVVLSKCAAQYGLEESLIERLINRFPYLRDPEGFDKTCGYDPRLITKLLYNYRSLPPLLKLPSQLFYNNDLIPTVSETDSPEARLLSTLDELLPKTKEGKTTCMLFCGVIGENYQTEDSPSWFNPSEASQVFYYVTELYRLGIDPADIGIITPYKAQTKKLMEVLKEGEFAIPKIGTVEDFQGQEYKVIVLSTVRSSSRCSEFDVLYKLGFVSSPRRLNVAITRAKSLMIIVGNPKLLSADKFWRTVIKYCKENGSYIGCSFSQSEEK